MDIETTAQKIVHSAIKVHKALGPGLLESVYQKCLAYELEKAGSKVRCEVPLPVLYEGITIDVGFRVDMIINDSILIENKTVDQITPIHEAQILTYLKMTKLRLGFLMNWKVVLMKHGIKRMVNQLEQWIAPPKGLPFPLAVIPGQGKKEKNLSVLSIFAVQELKRNADNKHNKINNNLINL